MKKRKQKTLSFKNILVAYDGSSFSKHAFDLALQMAKTNDSGITVLSVIQDSYSPIVGYAKIRDSILKEERKLALKHIQNLKSASLKQDVSFSFKIIKGASTVKEIIDFTNSGKFDLIVIGSHGRTGFNKLLLGSVSVGVSQHVKIPVLIVK